MSGLPVGWGLFRLAEVSLVEMGQSPKSVNYNINGIGLPFFQGKAEFRQTFPEIKKWCSSPTKTAESGDILLSIRAPVGPTNLAPTKCCIGRGLAAIHSEAGIDQGYVYYFFKSIESWLSKQGTGSTFSAISGPFVKDIEIPIPPAAEQNRIVTKLEELLSDLDAGVAELKAAQKKLVQYRQSLLKAAVEGKLTRYWREQHCAPSPQPLSHQGRGALGVDGVNDAAANYRPHLSGQNATSREQPPEFSNPPPSATLPSPLVGEGPGERGREAFETGAQLLARILKQRRANWEAKQLAKFQQQGKTPPKGWQDKYPEPVKPDTGDLPELPEGWVWASLDQLTSMVRNGLSQKPSQEPIGFPILRINAVRSMSVNVDEVRYLQIPESIAADYFLENGDLLATRYNGSVDLLGVFGVVRSLTTQTLHPDKLIRIKSVLEHHLADWIEIAATTFESRRHIVSRVKTTAGQTGISGEDVKKMPIPLPPSTEQMAAIDCIKKLLPEITAQTNYIETTLKQSAAQRQNILRAAFSGQLVPQNPNDEPASVLLERIRAERAARQAAKAPKKRSTKTAS